MTPEQEEQVRAALAAAPDAPTPMPPEVVARLQGVLDDLVEPRVSARAGSETREPGRPGEGSGDGGSARGGQGSGGSGTDVLAPRRRRRRRDLLVAAAAVVVIAGAGAAVLTHGSGAGTSGSADSGSSRSEPSGTGSGPRSSGSADGSGNEGRGSGGSGAAPPTQGLTGGGSAVPRLGTASLRTDLVRLVAAGRLRGPAVTPGRAGCAVPAPGRGERLVAVRLDGRRATLVLGPVTDGAREARVYSCADAGRPVARASVPAR